MSKIIKTMAEIVVGLLLLIFICLRLDYMYVPDEAYHRVLFHSFYDEKENIDNVFLGSSHVYCDINPSILNKINGENNFNMSTPGQRWDNTYFLLKEVAERNKLKHVYLECYFGCDVDYVSWNREKRRYEVEDYIDKNENYSRSWLTSYYMNFGINKFAIQLNASNLDHLMENVFPFVRYREQMFNWDYVDNNIEYRKSDEYQAYEWRSQDYVDADGSIWTSVAYPKGWVWSDGKLFDQEKLFPIDRDLEKYAIGEKSEKYIRKTIEFCEENNIDVTMFISPIFDTQLLSTGNYDNYVSEIRSIANEYNVDFYDFNLIKSDYLDIKEGKYYVDIGHLNAAGASIFTSMLWEILSGTASENAGMFFDTYAEKLQEGPLVQYGLYYKDIAPGDQTADDGSPIYTRRHYYVATNRNGTAEFCITRTISDGDDTTEDRSEIVQSYSKNDEFELPISEHGVLTIVARDGAAAENTISVNY